ncbi:DUF2911 domain-containing protein [Urechidicola croceus]|uniref:Dihydrolipoamide dehydrogenase n=1 Tax=Urechidicola croceus TaxID=1850246 RepID=A0A1D8P5A0_9FLAO|nr:DUF2911 domain-containing protein [Urechidicola croceus]AOW19726.1 hypothetical protein LPB138_03090 [Urechidicola croceus]
MNLKKIILFIAIGIQCSMYAQIIRPQASPAATIKQTVGLTDVTIDYSRPLLKGRDMFQDLTKIGKVWRTGANMCTQLTLSADIDIEGITVPEGKYSIYSIPGEESWKVIFNKKISWGTEYDENQDFIRINVPSVKSTITHESFTFYFSDVTQNSANLGFVWGDTQVELKLHTDTHSTILESIETTMSDESNATNGDFYNAADYYIIHKLDSEKALRWASKYLEIENDKYWAHGLQANALAYAGKFVEAIESAKKTIELAKNARNEGYVIEFEKKLTEWEK